MAGWQVRYDGPCSKCGTVLRAGTEAVWDQRHRKMHCLQCPIEAAGDPSPPPLGAGVAGASARREFERRQAKLHTARRERWGDRVGGLINRFMDDPQSTRAWAIGAAGEEELARKLSEVEGLQVLNDRRVPGTRGNIDHIVIAPAGIFVVDAKHMKGMIEIRDVGPFWRSDHRLYVGRRDKSSLAESMGWQVEVVRAALVAAGLEALPTITPVLCFIDGEWPLFRTPEAFNGVRLEGPKSIKKLIAASAVLHSSEIKRLADVLAAALPAK